MKEMFDSVRAVFLAILFELLAYLKPLGDEIFILAMVFIVNFVAGYITDIAVNKGRFQFKKAWRCVTEITVFFLMAVVVFTFGEKKNWNEGALQCVSFLTYVITYFYSLNILKNLKHLFKTHTIAHKVFSFLYYVMSVEFIKKIPFLVDFINLEGNVNDCNNKEK